ncbi:MAG TPA: DUF309 domain-containing protein [Candidatus Binatia bacterium]|jgi:hypothetical protein|nr:DUF309 domain-containing protein [Candidatus Binatia bacterium]
MKIATRDLLAELLVRALADQGAAAALRCLATYCQAVKKTPPAMPVDRFLSPAPAAEQEQVLQVLKQNPLLSWDLRGRSGRVTLASAFTAEWGEIISKLLQYGAALAEWVPDETAPPLTNALRKGVPLFNHQLFFEVHEVLEAQWVKESGAERRFLQGLIQIAVAFYHLGNHNLRGALSLLQDGVEKIAPHQPTFLGIELRDFVTGLEACRTELCRLGAEEAGRFQTERIPRMHFVH